MVKLLFAIYSRECSQTHHIYYQYYNQEMRGKQAPKPSLEISTSNGPTINVKCPKTNYQPSESKKTKPTPIKSLEQSEDSLSSTNNEEFLLLEIKQLRRQNNFLKKKVRQLTEEFGPEKPRSKVSKSKEKGTPPPNIDILPLSVNIFFEEIHNLLNTVIKLFRIRFTEDEIASYEERCGDELNEACPIKKHILLKKFYLKRKLDRILMEHQNTRFPLFLELFTEYYQSKEESESKIIETVDKMTIKAHELNEWIIQKAQEKKKSKGTYSTIKPGDDLPLETLRLPTTSPRNFVSNLKPMTYSPNGRKPYRGQKSALSPG